MIKRDCMTSSKMCWGWSLRFGSRNGILNKSSIQQINMLGRLVACAEFLYQCARKNSPARWEAVQDIDCATVVLVAKSLTMRGI
jgi:hypothetical protein